MDMNSRRKWKRIKGRKKRIRDRKREREREREREVVIY